MTATRPSASSVALCAECGSLVPPVKRKLPLAGSYSSTRCELEPPTSSTWPSASRVALCPERAICGEPLAAQVSSAGR